MKVLSTIKMLRESKQEEEVDTFTHDGQEYDLRKAKILVKDQEARDIPIKELDWLLPDIDTTPSRIKTADVDNPVIVVKWEKKWVVVDGAHRLTKAVREELKELPAKVLTADDLKSCKLK